MFLFVAQFLKILSVIYRLVQSNTYATKRSFIINQQVTKFTFVLYRYAWISDYFFPHVIVCFHRDIYYNNTQLFGSQKAVDSIVDDISCMLRVPRRSLHVASVHVVYFFVCLYDRRWKTLFLTACIKILLDISWAPTDEICWFRMVFYFCAPSCPRRHLWKTCCSFDQRLIKLKLNSRSQCALCVCDNASLC